MKIDFLESDEYKDYLQEICMMKERAFDLMSGYLQSEIEKLIEQRERELMYSYPLSILLRPLIACKGIGKCITPQEAEFILSKWDKARSIKEKGSKDE